MKYISPFLLAAALSVPGMSQDLTIPDDRWNLAEQYLAHRKDISGVFILGANGKIKFTYGSGNAKHDFPQRIVYTFKPLQVKKALLPSTGDTLLVDGTTLDGEGIHFNFKRHKQ